MSFLEAAETTSTIRCDISCVSDQVKPVSLIMFDKENKTLITKTEYVDDNYMDEKVDTTVENRNPNMPTVKTEDCLSEKSMDFFSLNYTEDQREANSVIKSEDDIIVKSNDNELKDNNITDIETDYIEHLISVVKAEENVIELAVDFGLSAYTGESGSTVADEAIDPCISVQEEPIKLSDVIKTEPSELNDFIKTEQYEPNLLSDALKIETAESSDIVQTEQYNLMNMESYEPSDTVQNDCEIVVKTEIDESNMFEYPEPLSNELNREEHYANNEDSIRNSYYISHQKERHGRQVLRHDTVICSVDRPPRRKRRKKLSTKMKDFETDYIPYTSRSKRNPQHKTRNAAEIENATSLEKRGMKKKKCEKRYKAKVPRKDLTIRENEAQQSCMEVPQVDITGPTKKSHICYKCGKQCNDEKNLELHMVEQHPRKKPCNFLKRCTEQYVDEGNSQLHMSTQHKEETQFILPHKCFLCNRRFDTLAYLESHLAQHDRVKSGKKDHTCPYCKRTFRWDTSLKNHLLHHTGEKPHICKVCKRGFSQPANLRRHMLSHDAHESGERKYKCTKCEKDFLYEPNLKRHMVSHNVLPHLCHVCGKGYIERYELHRHLLSHEKEKYPKKNTDVFTCHWCEKRFVMFEYYQKHEQTCDKRSTQSLVQNRSDAFICLWCGKEFFKADESRNHIQTCDKKPRHKRSDTLERNVLSKPKSVMLPNINYIPTVSTKSLVIPKITNSIPTLQTHPTANSLIPNSSPAELSKKQIVLIPMVSRSIQTAQTKPERICVPLSNSIPTAHTNSVGIPILSNSIATVPINSVVIPVIKNSIPTTQTKSVGKPIISNTIATMPINPVGIQIIKNSIPTAQAKPVVIHVPRMSSSPLTAPTKPVVIPRMSSSVLTVPTKPVVIPVITNSIPTVQTSRAVHSTVRNSAPTDLSKMPYVIKFNFCCNYCGKTFEHVDSFKTHTINCKPGKPLVSTGVLRGNEPKKLQSLIPDDFGGNMPSNSINLGGIKPIGPLFIPSSCVSVNHGGNKSGSVSDRLGRSERSEIRPDTSSENVTTSTANRLSMSASGNVDLTENEVETASFTKTKPSESSDNLSGNSAFSTPMTPVCPLPTSENESENDITLPVCPFPEPLSP